MISQSQGYSLAKNAGLSDARAKIAAAVMMAESGGDPGKVTKDSDDESYGLWQINMLGDMGPSRRFVYRLKSNNDLLDAGTNARVMSAISHQGANWSAWGAYTNGSYLAFMKNPVVTVPVENEGLIDKATGAVSDAAQLIPGVSQATAVANSLGTITKAVTNTAHWVSNPKNWVRIAYVLGGGMLIYVGIETVVLPMIAKPVGQVVGAVGPTGTIGKVSKGIGKVGKKVATKVKGESA